MCISLALHISIRAYSVFSGYKNRRKDASDLAIWPLLYSVFRKQVWSMECDSVLTETKYKFWHGQHHYIRTKTIFVMRAMFPVQNLMWFLLFLSTVFLLLWCDFNGQWNRTKKKGLMKEVRLPKLDICVRGFAKSVWMQLHIFSDAFNFQ